MNIQSEMVEGKERIWFPAVEYRNKETGEITRYPPAYTYPKDTSYYVIVNDVTEYTELCARGLIFDPRHTGREPKPLIDNRNTKI